MADKTQYVRDKAGFVYVRHPGMDDALECGDLQACDAPAVAAPEVVAPAPKAGKTAKAASALDDDLDKALAG